MGGEDRLNTDVMEGGENFRLAQPERTELVQIVGPETFFGLGAFFFLAETTDLRGGAFFDDIE